MTPEHTARLLRLGATLLSAWLLAACAHGDDMRGDSGRPASAADLAAALVVETLQLEAAAFAPDMFRVRVYLPPGYDPRGARRYPVLYINDGQDMGAVGLQPTLAQLYADAVIRPLIVVAIDMPRDRMAGYGLSDRSAARSIVADTRFGPVGTTAHAYAEWVANTLVPTVDARYRTRASAEARAVLGWSLGALAAFNLGWQYPELFGRVGAFSPSFWLAADRSDAAAIQRTRLVQGMVERGPPRAGLKLFFAVGSAEETDDRDGDGVIDAIDDTRDLIDGWHDAAGLQGKGLRQLGYRVNLQHATRATRDDVALLQLAGGEHNQASWARMLPVFLRWAYPSTALP